MKLLLFWNNQYLHLYRARNKFEIWKNKVGIIEACFKKYNIGGED